MKKVFLLLIVLMLAGCSQPADNSQEQTAQIDDQPDTDETTQQQTEEQTNDSEIDDTLDEQLVDESDEVDVGEMI